MRARWQASDLSSGAVRLDGETFHSRRLHATLEEAGAHGAVLVAVSAGPEAEEYAQQLWREEKPDEYFFLEVYGSAVVEHLVTTTGARLCGWAEERGMAVLPHYSPGYSGWDIAEQSRLLELFGTCPARSAARRCASGALRPKKSLLAVFGLTRHVDRVRRLTDLMPCENCSFSPCQFRRAPYRRSRTGLAELPVIPQWERPSYSVNPKALKRWAAERLTLEHAPRRHHRRTLPLRRHHLHQHGPPAGVRLLRQAGTAAKMAIPSANSAARPPPAIPATPRCASTWPTPRR